MPMARWTLLAAAALAVRQGPAPAPLPTFDRVLQLEPAAETSANASVGDVNGDSRPDIVVANRSDSSGADYVCFNRGAGRFDDGQVDIVTARSDAPNVVYFGRRPAPGR